MSCVNPVPLPLVLFCNDSAPLGKTMKSEWRACSPDGFIIFPRGGQAAKPLCPSATRNAKRSESGVLNHIM